MAGKDFDGWVVVVTGASTGLGRAIAVETAQRGARAVVINYASSAEEAGRTGALVQAEGAEAVIVQADVADDEACRRIVAARFGARARGALEALSSPGPGRRLGGS